MIKNVGDATVIVPLIKDYLEVSVKNDYELVKRMAEGTLKIEDPDRDKVNKRELGYLACYWGRGKCSQQPYMYTSKWKTYKVPSWGTISTDCNTRASIGRPASGHDDDWHMLPPWHDIE